MKPDYTLLDQTAQALGCPLRVDEPMARHTTFQIGGPADRFLIVENAAQLQGLLSCLRQAGIPYLVLGKGSNLLVSDKGIRGAVLHLGGDFKKVEVLPDGRTLRLARERSLTGLEFAWGIPGSVGGGAYMDAGAYGGEMRDVVSRVLHLGPDGAPGEARGEELCFGYRKSRYTGGEDIITAVEFTLQPGDPAAIAGKMEELMARRKDKQPYDMPSAGSVFKRPQNGFAAVLIEQCGLKGRRVGGAQVSEKHAGFIVNTGGATCQDVLELISIIRKTVEERTGTCLECEVRVTGEE